MFYNLSNRDYDIIVDIAGSNLNTVVNPGGSCVGGFLSGTNICLKCDSAYLLQEGICFKKVFNCLNQKGKDCFICLLGTILQGGSCYASLNNFDTNLLDIYAGGSNGISMSNGSSSSNSSSTLSNSILNVITPSVTQPSALANTTASSDLLSKYATGSATSTSASSSDPFCIYFSGGICQQCAFRYFYNASTKMCAAIQDQCATFNSDTGSCNQCFNGYKLVNGKC